MRPAASSGKPGRPSSGHMTQHHLLGGGGRGIFQKLDSVTSRSDPCESSGPFVRWQNMQQEGVGDEDTPLRDSRSLGTFMGDRQHLPQPCPLCH